MKKIIFSLLVMLVFVATSIAQEDNSLMVEYNLYTDQVIYSRNGKIIDKPVVKTQEKISVIITEFNPNIYSAKVEVSKINYTQTTSQMEGFGQNTNFSGSGMGTLFSGLSMGSDFGQSSFGGSDNGGLFGFTKKKASEEHQEAFMKYEGLNAKYEVVEQKLGQSYKKLQLFQMSEKSRDMALADISRLKTNPNIRPSRIKELIEEEIRYAFAKNEGETIDIDDLINDMAREAELAKSLENYASSKTDYEKIAKEWDGYGTYLNTVYYSSENAEILGIKAATQSKRELIQANLQKMEKDNIESRFASYDADLNASKMAVLRQEYEELQGNIFRYTFPPILAEGDEVNIRIAITNKKDSYQTYKSIDQKIKVEGNWKITGGVGLSFGGLRSPAHRYSVINNTIVEDKIDDFVPFMTSFAHIYVQKQRGINFAGSFGIGTPLSARETIKSISFFLGPSIIIGSRQRMLITTGILGAKVSRLSAGLKPGDAFNSISNTLPYTEKYEMGYFIGISYDIL